MLALALAPLGGPVAAQLPDEWLTLALDEFDRAVRPPDGLAETVATIEGPCTLLTRDRDLEVTLVASPSWARVVADPTVVTLDALACTRTFAVEIAVRATATRDAPADATGLVALAAEIAGLRSESATMLRAGYFALLDVRTAGRVALVAPGEAVEVPVDVENLGNGATVIDLELAGSPTQGFRVELPDRLVLDARQNGAEDTVRARIHVTIAAPSAIGFVEREARAQLVAFARQQGREDVQGFPSGSADAFAFEVRMIVRGVDVPTTLVALLPLSLAVLALAFVAWTARRRLRGT